MRKKSLDIFLFPIIVFATLVATIVVSKLNNKVSVLQIDAKTFSVSLLYIILWSFVLFIGYKRKNLFVVGYTGLVGFLSLISFLLFYLVNPHNFLFSFNVLLTNLWYSIFNLLGGIILWKIDALYFIIPVFILTVFTVVSIILFCFIKKKQDITSKESFRNYIKSKQGLVVSFTIIALIVLLIYCGFLLNISRATIFGP